MHLPSRTILQHRYVIQRPLGEGGMGTSYLAQDLLRGSDVTLKLLRHVEPALIEAFRAEFMTLRGVIHPHVCQVHDFGTVRSRDGAISYFYTSEFIDGITLDRYVQGRTWREAAGPLIQALDGLRFLHGLKVLHGDFKPQNILVRADGRAVLIDLSCSAPLDTRRGHAVSGTPGFIAPELLSGHPVDHRADLYAVGVTIESLSRALQEHPPKPIEQLAQRLTRESPQRRPSDVQEVLEVLSTEATAVAAPCVPPARLLGRGAELQVFQSMLDALTDGRAGPRGLLVCGPDGSGRTRLLQEMKWTAQLQCDVVEGYIARGTPIATMLRRATNNASLSDDLQGVLQARDLLLKVGEPLVLLLDDAHLLSDREKELLFGLLRSLEPTDPFLIVCTSSAAPPLVRDEVRTLSLGALGDTEVAQWVGDRVSQDHLREVMRLTGGFPASVHALLSMLGTGGFAQSQLDRHASRVPLSQHRIESIRALPSDELRLLGLFAVLDGAVDSADADALCASREALCALLQKGWIQAGTGGYKLTRAGETRRILEALSPDLVVALHDATAKRLRERLTAIKPGTAAASEHTARLIHHLAHAGLVEEARTILLENKALYTGHPAAWALAAQSLAHACPEPVLLLLAAEISESSGQSDTAISLLAALRRARPAPEWLCRLHLQAGACYLRIGKARRALHYINCALLGARDGDLRARALDLLCRAHIKQGAYADALAQARRALEGCADKAVKADLHEDIGVAASYLGDAETARAHLRLAALIHEETENTRAQIRSAGYQALNEFRTGNTVAAARGFRIALEIAERHGTSNQIAGAVLNFGTACHQIGDLGQALSSYERALRMAVALGAMSTEATLRYNVAKLYADIGLFERAEAAAHKARARAEQASARLLVGTVLMEQGNIALCSGDYERAIEHLSQARRELSNQAATREVVEVDLHLADALLSKGDHASASDAIALAGATIAKLRAEDLSARMEMMQGRLLLAENSAAAAIPRLEDALDLAHRTGQRGLQAEILKWLAAAYEQQGSRFLAERHRSLSRELWERMTTSLPKHLLDVFWSHPHRAGLRAAGNPSHAASPRERKLERLLDINKKLSSSLDVKTVLSCAIDSAIELTGAERGFVILEPTDGDALEVAVARNMDHERVGKSHMKFSRSIAERVISAGAPVTTANAQEDPRFSANQSVHAMRLQSVVSVPICSTSGVLGALYLDHRFRLGLFGDEDVQLLRAFADQVAIALLNARLHDELARRTEELLKERQRIEQLMRGQTEEIERLTEQVRVTQDTLQHRHDYGNIVGRSAAMRSVLAKLDRVIDTTLSVLIQGESGTGKELIAKAIHWNSARRGGPFVAVNCGAMPEALLESELFGHVRGAFTGATHANPGLFAAARGGTLFLDELGELPLGMQVKLLRALQEREVRPVGSTETVPIDIRLVCATNRKLLDEVAEGTFRSDLFYRVSVIEIHLPPLRERAEDIPELARHILEQVARAHERPAPELTRDAMRKLMAHTWTGNVRELENVLTKAALLTGSDSLNARDLDLPDSSPPPPDLRGRTGFQEQEAKRIEAALAANAWNVSEVSRALRIPRTSLYRKLQRYGIACGAAIPARARASAL